MMDFFLEAWVSEHYRSDENRLDAGQGQAVAAGQN